MEEASRTTTRRLILEAGNLVVLHPDESGGGLPIVVPVDQVANGKHWFLGSCDPVQRGEFMLVEMPIPRDARYVTRARVFAASPNCFALEIERDWERVQQRAFIRISSHGVQVRVVRLGASSAEGEQEVSGESLHDLAEISAGGIRFESEARFEIGEEVICHFELPGSLCFVLPARIVRGGEMSADSLAKPGVAVEFMGLDEHNRSQLLRWVYREQVRRHRDESRDSDES